MAQEKKRAANKKWTDKNSEKQKEAIRKWKENNPEKVKEYAEKGRDAKNIATRKYRQTEQYKRTRTAYWYKVRYNLSLETYNDMVRTQNYVCAICKQPEKAKNSVGEIRPLAVDHCHTTGKIRGLLCHTCNVLLGKARDDSTILQNAITYLENYKECPR